ncbi:MAG: 3-hydroxyacyl-CoA dehydrogenase NAD-binding domain-containing protein [Bacteriovoracaceae bacterium]
MSYSRVTCETKENIAYIGFGKYEDKSMTTLTKETLEELRKAVDEVAANQGNLKGLIFFSHKPDVFLAGVDVTIISGLSTEAEASHGAELGQAIYNIIEDLKIPTLACVDGICLGGGTELVLSCKTILASDSNKTAFGLPEVMLGVLPGFGGTYRLPRRIGIPNALDMILTGKQIRAAKGRKMGLVDYVMPKERLLELAPSYLGKRPIKKKKLKEQIEELATDNFITRKIIFQKAREKVLETSKGFYPAPLKIIDLLENYYGKSRNIYLSHEAQMFGELSQTKQSKNLQHIFFLTDASKKMDKSGKIMKVKRGGVLGAGTMGGGIAWLFANANQAPIMKDISPKALELGLKQSSMNFMSGVKKKKMSFDEFEKKQRSITATMNYDGFENIDMVIEAVVENMDIKKKVFAETEKHVRPDCILTSNTSSLSVNEMSKALEKPERFAGLHFFNPVHRMPLVEIITHDKASKETIDSLYKWCLDVKKTPIVVKDGPGFLVNRILMPFINESAYLLEEGVSIEALDQAVLNFGMPMGVCRLMDEVGIDVLVKVGKIMHDGLGDRAYPSSLSAKVVEGGFLGKKNSKGFYLYDEAGKQQGLNLELQKLLPTTRKEMDETQIQMRVFLPMINEAANILADGIVDHASAVDLGVIYGIGFPPFKGGLMKYADGEGLDRILSSIEKFAETVSSERYRPSEYLQNLVAKRKKFYDA